MSIVSNRFPKSLRLHLKRDIDELFKSGLSIKVSSMIGVYKLFGNQPGVIKMAVSVPKKRVKLATDRNLIKRRIKEAYRLNSQPFRAYFEPLSINVHIIFIYTGKVSPDYASLESKIILILQRLVKAHEVGSN